VCVRERERVREQQQQDFSTSHGETRAQDLAIHIIFVFSNRSVHPSAEVPIKNQIETNTHTFFVLDTHNFLFLFLDTTTTSSCHPQLLLLGRLSIYSPNCRVPSRKRSSCHSTTRKSDFLESVSLPVARNSFIIRIPSRKCIHT